MALALDEGRWWQSAYLHAGCISRWVVLPRVVGFSIFLRLYLISLLSVAGCDDWGGFQSSGTAQVISQ
ncbi:hypothetical protein ACK33T_01180 [Aeromonas veronii]|nr:hypothetical protein [Aeromonas veronii]